MVFINPERLQLALLYICIIYRPRDSPEILGKSSRPLSFWQWSSYSQYIEFLAGLMWAFSPGRIIIICDIGFSLCQAILFLILGRSETFVSILGFVALGLESTLPIPQLLRSVIVIFVMEYTPHTIFALATIDSGRYMAFECQPLSVG